MIYITISCIIFVIALCIFVYNYIRFKKNIKEIYEEVKIKQEYAITKDLSKIREDRQRELEEYFTKEKSKKEEEFLQFNNELQEIQEKLKINEQILKENNKRVEESFNQQRQIVDAKVSAYEAAVMFNIKTEMNDIRKQAQEQTNKEIEEIKKKTLEYDMQTVKSLTDAAAAQQELENIKLELEEFRAKRAAINELRRKEEELAAEQDGHRIILSEDDKEDIKYLISIEDKIHNVDLLHKLIWSEYLQKPFNQMLNNIFGSKIPKNVIYCIENISDNKKYIGKTSAEVSKRWTEHIKTSLGIGGVKKSKIHSMLFNNWDNFTFSVVEVVENANLSEREKYYIQFFETDKYGYNLKSGG